MGTLYTYSASIIMAHAYIGHAFAYITFVYECMLYAHATIIFVLVYAY
jgi:hypothetical protein